jgi:peptidyl-prolyl cis-trans isomerase B (cyclophilin B)
VSCHRIIKGFAIQCGDPTGTGSGKNPGYTIPDELPTSASDYVAGTLVMANTGEANTGGSQFFISLDDTAKSLTATYSLFGKVTDGFDTTVRAIEAAADPTAQNGVPTKEPITMTKVTITES